MASIRFLMLLCLALSGICWLLYRWTGHALWRRRSLLLLWGMLGTVTLGATVLWLHSL